MGRAKASEQGKEDGRVPVRAVGPAEVDLRLAADFVRRLRRAAGSVPFAAPQRGRKPAWADPRRMPSNSPASSVLLLYACRFVSQVFLLPYNRNRTGDAHQRRANRTRTTTAR
jgi:hypothetical protein